MSRVPRWKLEKTKVKVVFRLQFHATHVPQQGWDKLFISFVPLDTGKVAAKTTKANVRNGNCKWADPIYETTRLLQDIRTKKYDEKLYKIVVSMGTSRSSILGEGYINLADFADALKPSSAALPLEGCEHGTILHVSVQLLTSKTGFREFEQQREVGEKGDLPVHDPAEKVQTSHGASVSQSDKVGNRVKFKPDLAMLPSLQEVSESNQDEEDATAGLGSSSYMSESINNEKSDIIGTPDASSITSKVSGHATLHWMVEKPDNHILAEGCSDMGHNWSSDHGIDSDLTTTCEGTGEQYGSLKIAESSMSEIRMEVSSLQKLAEEIRLETKNALQQLSTDITSGESWVKEVSILKSECIKIRTDMEELKHAKETLAMTCAMTDCSVQGIFPLLDNNRDSLLEVGNSVYLCAQMPTTMSKADQSAASVLETVNVGIDVANGALPLHAQQMKWLQDLTYAESKVKEIHNKTQYRYSGDNFNILSDLVDLKAVFLNLKQDIITSIDNAGLEEMNVMNGAQDSSFKKVSVCMSEDHFKEDSNYMMEERLSELLAELERSKVEQENLLKKMGQMEHYYETLIQDLEDIHRNTSAELDIVKSEHSKCCYTISAFQIQIEKMQQDMNEQSSRFTEDKRNFDELKRKLEKRLCASETTLKRIRRNYSLAAERLQKDLELLSSQVLSLFETSENLARQSLGEFMQILFDDCAENSGAVNPDKNLEQYLVTSGSSRTMPSKEPPPNTGMRMEKNSCVNDWNLEKDFSHVTEKDTVQVKGKSELNSNVLHVSSIADSSRPLCLILNEYAEVGIRSMNDAHTTEEMKRLCLVLQETYVKTKTELSDMLIANVSLEVFLSVLQEVLRESLGRIRLLEKECDDLSQKLSNSMNSNQLLERKLQNTVDHSKTLQYSEARHITECKDLTLRNHILEAKIQAISDENFLLSERVAECQVLTRNFNELDTKYKACNAERLAFENLLKLEKASKDTLEKEFSSLLENNDALRRENSDYFSLVNDLQAEVNFANEKLEALCLNFSYSDDLVSKPSVVSRSTETNLVDKILLLEELQEGECKMIYDLRRQKKEIEEERNTMCNLLRSTELHLQELASKLNETNSYNENLQLKLQHASEKLDSFLEAEALQAEKNKELSSKLASVELELQRKITDSSQFVKKIHELEEINEELERTKLGFMNCMHEKETLVVSIQLEIDKNMQLEDEIYSLKERLASAHNDIVRGRDSNEKINDSIRNLTVRLVEKQVHIDEQKSEIARLNLQISELEANKSQLQHLVFTSEQLKTKLEGEKASLCVQLSKMETELLRLQECGRSLDLDLKTERSCMEKLSVKVADLTSQLDEKDHQLLCFEKQKAELSQLHQKFEELEYKKSKFFLALSECHEVRKYHENEIFLLRSQITDLENSLGYTNRSLEEAHGKMLAERRLREKVSSTVGKLESELSHKDEQIQRGKNSEQKLDVTIRDLTCILNKKSILIDEQKYEIFNLKQQISDLELKNHDLNCCFTKYEELQKKADDDNFSLHVQVSGLETELHKLKELLESAYVDHQSEKVCRENLERKVSVLTLDANEKDQQLMHFESQKTELLLLHQRVLDLESEKANLQCDLLKNQEHAENLKYEITVLHSQVTELENDKSNINQCLAIARDELHVEKGTRQKFEGLFTDIQAELVEKERQIVAVRVQQQEHEDIELQIANLEEENSEYKNLLLKEKESKNKFIIQEALLVQMADLESQNREFLEFVIAADLEVTFIKTHFSSARKVLSDQLNALDVCYKDLQLKYLDENYAQKFLVPWKSECINENGRLAPVSTSVNLKNDVVASSKLKRESSNRNVAPCEVRESVTEQDGIEGKSLSRNEVNQLRIVKNLEEEIDKLRSATNEFDILFTVLKLKLDEQREYMAFLKESGDNLVKLREQQNELSYRLSEQILKTEEFKNLSIHLKELKDKADAEYLHMQEKREIEGPSIAIQETLRMAFIKEQYETKVQEMKNQLSASKKHGEELLTKLQNAVDELEFRKKNEVSHLKRNNDLSAKLAELEGELDNIISDRKKLRDVCDRMKAELECCSISLDCCRDDKLRLETSLRECNEERTKSKVELDLVKRRLEILSSSLEIFERDHEPGGPNATPFRQLLDGKKVGLSLVLQQSQTARNISLGKDKSKTAYSNVMKGKDDNMMEIDHNLIGNEDKILQLKSEAEHICEMNKDIHFSGSGPNNQDSRLQHIVDFNDQLIEREPLQNKWATIQNELERLRNEGLDSLVPFDECHVDPDLHGLQQELSQLEKANEHLRNMFPSFKEFSCTGNALEKVLVLELELAGALEKKKNIHFESSFIRQHDDEEAIFKSFKDINELIKEMLELKGRYAAVESELKDMQGRYSQLSLQFSEVEGERQKLIMILKNRTPKKH